MFEHSIKVPRLYKTAANLAKKVKEDNTSVKNLVYQKKYGNIKALYALIVETLLRYTQIDFLLKRSKLLDKEPQLNPWLARVLITELLWRKKNLTGDSKPIKTILAYQQVLNAHMCDFHENSTKNEIKVTKPRFVRVNTLIKTVNEAIDEFKEEGWKLKVHVDVNDYEGFISKVSNLNPDEFMVDIHIKELLIFPHNTQFYEHDAYEDGSIILQDKASCFPVYMLNAPPDSTVLDMCAAPGVKTSQIASSMNNEGCIYAIDKDEKRFDVLNKFLEKSGVTCVKTINKDILTLSKKDCPNVEYILVDPSCSGSGIVNRLDLDNYEIDEAERMAKLTGFQIKILKHALRNFPTAKRIVYSTCSINPKENEEIVQEVMNWSTKYKLISASRYFDTPWACLGSSEYDVGTYCLYTKPEIDRTNGFFIAVFERLKEGEVNQFLKCTHKRFETNDTQVKTVDEHKSESVNMEGNDCLNKKEKKEDKNKTSADALNDSYVNGEDVQENNVNEIYNKKCKKRKVHDATNELNLESKANKKKRKSENPELLTNEHDRLECENTKLKKKKHKKEIKSKDNKLDSQILPTEPTHKTTTLLNYCYHIKTHKKKCKNNKQRRNIEAKMMKEMRNVKKMNTLQNKH